jgi:hypothetical protein
MHGSRGIVVFLVGAVVACGCAGDACTSISDPSGAWSHASRVDLSIYDTDAHCTSGGTVVGAATPMLSRTFDPGDTITFEVSPGHRAIVLTLFADQAANVPLATACSEGDFVGGSDACIALELQPLVACERDGDCATGSSGASGDDGGRCCAHRCVNIFSDASHCGACGFVCSGANAVPSCAGGSCAWSCASGFGHCSDGNTGCETELGPNGLRSCGGSACVPAASCCGDGDCVAPPGPAACYQPGVCSGVGGSCSYALEPGAMVCGTTCCRALLGTCNSDCTISCVPWAANCDGDPANGCEVNLYDVNHCGGCRTVCSYPNALATCPTGTCVLSACNEGYQDCDGQNADGCECKGSGCCGGGTCQVQHSNGVGQSFFDCVPLGTYDQTQATSACVAFTGDATLCHATTSCSGSGNVAVCSDGSTSACNCWIYGGISAGHVNTGLPGNCSCKAQGSTPTWN